MQPVCDEHLCEQALLLLPLGTIRIILSTKCHKLAERSDDRGEEADGFLDQPQSCYSNLHWVTHL